MRTLDDLEQEVRELRELVARKHLEYDQYGRRLTDLLNKLRFPGTRFLLDLLFKVVFDGTITAATGVTTYSAAFDQANDLQQLPYILSAKLGTAGRSIVFAGTLIVGTDLAAAIERQYIAGAHPYQQTRVAIYNIGATIAVPVKVWRVVGLT